MLFNPPRKIIILKMASAPSKNLNKEGRAYAVANRAARSAIFLASSGSTGLAGASAFFPFLAGAASAATNGRRRARQGGV